MRKPIKCRGCGEQFFTKQIKVYVFKERMCNKCKTIMNVKGNLRICSGCGLVVDISKKEDQIAYGLLGVAIRGTSRNVIEAEEHRQLGTQEVEKVYVDEADLCQKCQNFLTRRMQAQKNMERKGECGPVKVFTKEESIAEIQKMIQRKVKAEAQEAARKAEEEQRLKDAKAKVTDEVIKATL
jgi:hypothetical protein